MVVGVWDVAEVEDAKTQQLRVGRWACVNELEEHADAIMSGPQFRGRNYRRFDMADSFDRGGFCGALTTCGCGLCSIEIAMDFRRWGV